MKYNINKQYITQFAYDSVSYLKEVSKLDILELDYGNKEILDDIIYIGKYEPHKVEEDGVEYSVMHPMVSNSGINYTYFLLIKIPKAGSIPATNSAKFLERYDYTIMPIVWMGKHGWTRQHIDDIEGRSSNEINAVIPLDYRTKRMEWAILKKPINPFINWPIRNPMEVKE